MTLTNPEWALVVENETRSWTYETFPGDLNPPYGDVWISEENFSLEWGFDGESSPGPLDASTFQIALTCATAADIPPVDYGDQILVTLTQPDGALSRDPGTGIVTGDYGPSLVERPFWVTDMVSIEKRDRMVLTITATTAVPDITLNVREFIENTYVSAAPPATADWQSWAEANIGPPGYPTNYPWPHIACVVLTEANISQPGYLPVRAVMEFDVALDGHHAVGVKIGDQITLRELLDGTHALWLAPAGWDGRAHGCAFVWDTAPGGTSAVRHIRSYPWDPEANAPHAAPFELTYVSSVLAAELLAGFTPAAGGSTLGLLDGDWIVASPEWRKAAAGSVGLVEYKGAVRVTGSPDTDEDVTLQSYDGAGGAVRSIDSLAYLLNGITPAINFPNSGSLETARIVYLGGKDPGATGWVPESFDIRPRYMTDDVWAALGPLFWPVNERQITLVLMNIDPDDDMADGRLVFLTMLGCSFSIADGHLTITPKCRPYLPPAINGVTDSASWTDVDTAFPAATWAQADENLTWAQAALASV